MDASNLISPLIALIAPIVVSAVRRPSSRTQDLTARLQYWKALVELAPLAGSTISAETKQSCLKEIADIDDETQNLNNKFVSHVTTAYALIVMFFCLLILERVETFMLTTMKQQFDSQPPPQQQAALQQFADMTQKFELGVLIIQVLVMCVIWFWARWKIRDFIWNHLRYGRTFHFLLVGNDRIRDLAELILFMVILPGAFWLIITIVYSVPLPPNSVR